MKRWLGLFCRHEWEIMGKHSVVEYKGDLPYGVLYVLKCKNCGDIKRKVVKP